MSVINLFTINLKMDTFANVTFDSQETLVKLLTNDFKISGDLNFFNNEN